MELPLILKKIKKSGDAQNYLDLLYDFTLIQPTEDSLKRGFKTDVAVLCFATDACGGTYALIGSGDLEKRPVVFISSEGRAGTVATSIDQFMALLLAMPFWLDVLKFSGGGKITEMEKAYKLLEQETELDMNELLEDDEDPRRYKAVQKLLKTTLDIKECTKPIQVLYDAIHAKPEFKVYAKKDGKPYDGLFNKYVTTDNPMWKQKGRS
jgi:hypothetical protein